MEANRSIRRRGPWGRPCAMPQRSGGRIPVGIDADACVRILLEQLCVDRNRVKELLQPTLAHAANLFVRPFARRGAAPGGSFPLPLRISYGEREQGKSRSRYPSGTRRIKWYNDREEATGAKRQPWTYQSVFPASQR